jgi:hypothetical protein
MRQKIVDRQDELREKFGSKLLVVANVSQSIFSVARHYGCCTINGAEYTYFADDDLLVRNDVVAYLCVGKEPDAPKTKAKPKQPKQKSNTLELF